MAGHFGGNPYKWDFPAGPNNPHIARYMMAKGFVFPWETVLDAACAQGYGSKLIALNAGKVIGYEVDEGCIADANNNKPDNCEFKLMDLNECELPDVDVAITLETVEHTTPEGMKHFISQLKKHVRRCIIVSVPLGGTSYAYVNEPPGPATEKNDFGSHQDVQKLFQDDEWHELTHFDFGYSHFGIYFKGQPLVPKEWEKRLGVLDYQYEKA
jgi:hypothetical protein